MNLAGECGSAVSRVALRAPMGEPGPRGNPCPKVFPVALGVAVVERGTGPLGFTADVENPTEQELSVASL